VCVGGGGGNAERFWTLRQGAVTATEALTSPESLSACTLVRICCLRFQGYKVLAANFGGMYLPKYTVSCNKNKNINSQRRNKELKVTTFKSKGRLKSKIPGHFILREFPCDQGE
jgi:hypothetical protein